MTAKDTPDDAVRFFGDLAPDDTLAVLRDKLIPDLENLLPPERMEGMARAEILREVKMFTLSFLNQCGLELNLLDQRDLVSLLTNTLIESLPVKEQPEPETPKPSSKVAVKAPKAPVKSQTAEPADETPEPVEEQQADRAAPSAPSPEIREQLLAKVKAKRTESVSTASRSNVDTAKARIQPLVLERIDTSAAARMAREDLSRDLKPLVGDLLAETRIQLNAVERHDLVEQILNDMLGLGPLEPLLANEEISEVMVNGPKQVYCESKGKLTLTDVKFRDNAHVMAIATRIVTAIGRRIDESSPLCDARLADGSRVNIIIPPLAIDGPSITIRKFSKKKITLETMIQYGSMSEQMAKVLRIVGRCRLNVLISGGTGSGKTTLLNALSQMIDHGERIVTIEDAAELQLQQPHVVRLETRPPNIEGHGEVTMRDLLKNALRMRPDRIIVGETRGGEAIDMLQAMNTGHDGSLSTVHANRPREAIMRLENMVGLGGANLAPRAIHQQIASAIDMIIQVARMRDGSRRVTHITEILGMEGEVIATQDLFTCEVLGETPDGHLKVEFRNHGLRPHCAAKAAYFGLESDLLEAVTSS